MKLNFNQLYSTLVEKKPSLFLIAGTDEILLNDAKSLLVQYFQKQGFAINQHQQLKSANDYVIPDSTGKLFPSRDIQILDIQAKALTKALETQLEADLKPLDDVIQIITIPKAISTLEKKAWVKQVNQHGVLLPIYYLNPNYFEQWLKARIQFLGIRLSSEAFIQLRDACDGNVLQGITETNKLQVLFPKGTINPKHLSVVNGASDHHHSFELIDQIYRGNTHKILEIVAYLKQKNLEISLINWSLQQEIKTIHQSHLAKQHRGKPGYVHKSKAQYMPRLLKQRRDEDFDDMFHMIHKIDTQYKTGAIEQAWLNIERLSLVIAKPEANALHSS